VVLGMMAGLAPASSAAVSAAGYSQQAELTASDAATGDSFGDSVALSGLGNTALAGAPFHNPSDGAVYVFTEGRGA
jgi:FG-GAP repeat